MKLKTLSISTAVLFFVSILVFVSENRRGTDLVAGSDYIKGLDVGNLKKIVLNFKDDKKIILTRDEERFILENHKFYPASSDKVNDLIYKIASIQIKEKVSSGVGKKELEKYELDQKSRKCMVELFDNDGKKTISFSVGKSHKGRGNYLYREREGKKEVYLSQNSLWINSSYKDFIDTILLDVNSKDIEKVGLKSDVAIELSKGEKGFVVTKPKSKKSKFKKDKIDEYINGINKLKFEDYFTPTDPEISILSFNRSVEIQLKNKLIYKMSFARKKDDYFVKLRALIDEMPEKIVVSKDDGKDKLQNIENIVNAQRDAQRINLNKGPWVYQMDKSNYEKVIKNSKFFL